MLSSKFLNSTGVKEKRPLSPHLSIYKPQLTSVLSIFHRITGFILTLIVLSFIIFYKIYVYYGSYVWFYNFISTINNQFQWLLSTFIFLILFSFYYHTCNGIRHLMWDFGYGLNLKTVYKTGYTVIIISMILTILTWLIPALV